MNVARGTRTLDTSPRIAGRMTSRFVYTGVRVRDLDRSIRFYTEGLGMVLGGRYKIGRTGGENADLRTPGSDHPLELNWYPAEGMHAAYREGDELDHLAFEVGSLKETLERLSPLPGRITVAPFEEGGYWMVYVADPDGAWLELFSKMP